MVFAFGRAVHNFVGVWFFRAPRGKPHTEMGNTMLPQAEFDPDAGDRITGGNERKITQK
jgi:hypothetical protein